MRLIEASSDPTLKMGSLKLRGLLKMSSSLMSSSPDFTKSNTGLAFPARFLNNDGRLAISFTSLPSVTAGMVEVRRGVVVVISASLVVWPLVENTKSVEEGAEMVVVIGDVVD